ncbi:unnamed protein product [Moneuplotes crassus]|uniref:HTH myb-type domain-containing protein n=1 Tax=Euplotes crassus TaxID=5936 RepID=A0AAD1X8U2_EUPCR|nr:unnamed protein product [Moneuplotes crassus]
MIPTRSSIQIRSHCQKYLNQIKKDYQTDDPMGCVLRNMCDASPFYQFKPPEASPLAHIKVASARSECQMLGYRASFETKAQKRRKRSSLISSNHSDNHEIPHMKRRDMKFIQKSIEDPFEQNMQNFSSPDRDREECVGNNNQHYSDKSSRIEKASYGRSKSLLTTCTKLNKPNQVKTTEPKSFESRGTPDLSKIIKKGSNVLVLGNGKLLIQADMIKSEIPCHYQHLEDQIGILSHDGPCKVTIIPLKQFDSSKTQSKTQSQNFTSSNEENAQGNNFKPPLFHTSVTTNAPNINIGNSKEAGNQEFLKVMNIIKQIFCWCPRKQA